jgi:glycosyltransferase involved in cell wall biosynthesis
MKILIDFRKYDGVIGGVERGVIEITNYLNSQEHNVIMVYKASRNAAVEALFKDTSNLTLMPLKVQNHAMSLTNARLDSGQIPEIAVCQGVDIIHFSYNWSFPFRKTVPTLLTIHDVIPFAFREAMGFWRNLLLYKPGIRQACRLNDLIATVSAFSKDDIAKKVGVPLEKIRVIPNGLREPFKPDPSLEAELSLRYGLTDGFVLNVGGIHERKNIPRLIHAFAKFVTDTGFPGKLLITGSVSGAPYQEKMKPICDAAVRETGMVERVVFTGFIPDEELDSLLRGAKLLIYPSLYEGFGIPILEAMKVGTPVITSNKTAMPEVAGNAALLVDPEDIDQMAAEMARLLDDQDLRQTLIAKGTERAGHYSWQRTAEMYIEVYQELLERQD